MTQTLLHQIYLAIHLIGVAFGLGGAVVADFSLARALRMRDRLTVETVTWMRSFSTIVWIGLGLMAFSGMAMLMQSPQSYLNSPGFLAKMFIVGILVLNGIMLNFYSTARLTTFNFSEHYPSKGAAWWARKLSFTFGAVSTVSWYSALFIAVLKGSLSFSFYNYMGIYIALLLTAIISSLFLEYVLTSGKVAWKQSSDRVTIADLERGVRPTTTLSINIQQTAATQAPQAGPEPLQQSVELVDKEPRLNKL